MCGGVFVTFFFYSALGTVQIELNLVMGFNLNIYKSDFIYNSKPTRMIYMTDIKGYLHATYLLYLIKLVNWCTVIVQCRFIFALFTVLLYMNYVKGKKNNQPTDLTNHQNEN